MVKKYFKWSVLLLILATTVLLTLTFAHGVWGFDSWRTSSVWELGTTTHSKGHAGGYFRFMRVVIAFLGGGALAFAGTLLQKVTKNNLAEVSILGIGSINIMFIFAYVMIFKDQAFQNGIVGAMLPFITIFASIGGTLFIWLISRSKKSNKNTFVIIGIATQLLFEALSVVFINPTKLDGNTEGKKIWSTIRNYTTGNIRVDDSSPGATHVQIWLVILAATLIIGIIFVALMIRKKIDIYEANEDTATTLGINVKRLKLFVFILVALLAGIEATILGSVALLGIIAPSIGRMIFKNKFMPLAISSFIIGGTLVILASFISFNFGTGLPPGILTTAIASPYFIFLIVRGR